jgi:hypothetical protein
LFRLLFDTSDFRLIIAFTLPAAMRC